MPDEHEGAHSDAKHTEVGLSWEVSPRNITGRARDNARVLRRYQTPAEHLLWSELRGKRIAGLKFRRQVPVGRFIVDFLCFEAGLVVEADGSQHADLDVREYDDMRTHYLNEQGLRVLRFTNYDIETNLPSVLSSIASAALARTRSSPLSRESEVEANPRSVTHPPVISSSCSPLPRESEVEANPRSVTHPPAISSSCSPLPRGRGAGGEANTQPTPISHPSARESIDPESETIPCASS